MVATGLALTGCGENAEAKDENPLKLAEVAAVIPETQADCLKLELETQSAVMQCMRDVTARDVSKMDAEIAELDRGIAEDDETHASQEEEAKQLDTTIDVLSEVLEAVTDDQPSQ